MIDSRLLHFKFRGVERRYFTYQAGFPRFSEIDAYQVLWNGHYVNYMEQARTMFCRESGFDLKVLSDMGYYLPVHNYDVTMRKPILATDAITIGVRLKSADQGRFEFEHLVMVGRDVHAVGMVTHILVDKATLTPQYKLSDEIAALLRPLMEMLNDE